MPWSASRRSRVEPAAVITAGWANGKTQGPAGPLGFLPKAKRYPRYFTLPVFQVPTKISSVESFIMIILPRASRRGGINNPVARSTG